jgi:hypothetical protein
LAEAAAAAGTVMVLTVSFPAYEHRCMTPELYTPLVGVAMVGPQVEEPSEILRDIEASVKGAIIVHLCLERVHRIDHVVIVA